MNIYDYIADRVPEPISIYYTDRHITVSWMDGRRTRSRTWAYTPAKLEQACDGLVRSVMQAMGY